jgi:succinate dehydrogenase/fumarate reductase flavoprotein subunit
VRRIDTPFDEEFDVLVVGYGFSGATSAIAASDAGASVLLVEKMPDPGGISVCAGGGIRIAADSDEAFAYLRATSGGKTPEDLLRAFAQGMVELPEYMRRLVEVNGAKMVGIGRTREGNYPFPGTATLQFIDIESVPGFDASEAYPHAIVNRSRSKSSSGANLFKVLQDNVRRRPIEVRLATPARRLISNSDGAVIGVAVETAGRLRTIKARRAVILACGGFEADHAMQRQYWQDDQVLPAVGIGNTGDGIRMAQAVGADLWHMWHYHGGYGFRHPDPNYPVGIRMKRLPDWVPGSAVRDFKLSWILLGKTGERFMNECPPYTNDTAQRSFDVFDPVTQSFPFIPAHIVIDEEGRKMYPLASAVYNDRNAIRYQWSQDNLKEVELGILQKAESVSELAVLLQVDAQVLERTLARWNAHCANQRDDDFGRPAITMVPIKTPPYYCGKVWPVVSNTQGGPVHDAKQRVLNPFAEPIPRLYEAGELGSIWGHLYLSGGNLAECLITGRIAGREAAALTPWDVAHAEVSVHSA